MIVSLESKSNEKVKNAVKLASSSKFRQETGRFFLQGLRLIYDAFLTGTEIEQFFFTQEALNKNPEKTGNIISKSKESFKIRNDIAEKLSDTKNHQGLFAVCKMPNFSERKIDFDKKYIALENIQDPSNLGAIIRTAEALGINGAILFGCCDPYNPKAQRSAMGSLLRMPLIFAEDLAKTLNDCKNNSMKVFATVPDSNAENIINADLSGGVVAVIGNEGNGVTQEIKNVSRLLTIPMLGRAESLNASMAAAIVMWEIMKQQ